MKYLDLLLKKKLKKEKITMLTAYDYTTARIIDECGIDIILVGDSYGMVKLGYPNTLPVSMEEMLIATKSVSRAVKESIIIADMPFLSYQTSIEKAIYNAGLFLKETKAQGVKIETTLGNIDLVKRIVELDIPVMGHIGITPQSIYKSGGYKIQAKSADSAEKIINLAIQLEMAGIFAIVLEGITIETAKIITNKLKIPTIGIGSGKYCDGQVLVIDDLLGMNPDFSPKHNKKYADLYSIIKSAVKQYKEEVEKGIFPDEKNSVKMSEVEYKKLLVEKEKYENH